MIKVDRDKCQALFTREPGLKKAEGARFESPVIESGMWISMKLVGLDKTPRMDGLPYGLYTCPYIFPCLD